MDKEYYTPKEYKKIDEYKRMSAEDYRGALEHYTSRNEYKRTPEENKDIFNDNRLKAKPASKPEDTDGLRKILDKITATSAATTASASVIVAGAAALVVVPEIAPDLPPIAPNINQAKLDLSLATITGLDVIDYYYTGSEIKPEIGLSLNGSELNKDDYLIEYENNLKPGIAKIKIKPNNERIKGELEATFIIRRAINEIKIEYKDNKLITNALYGTPTLNYYTDSECLNKVDDITKPGTYYVRAELMADEYYEECMSNVLEYIVPINLMDCNIELLNSSLYYKGEELKPEFKLSYNGALIDISSLKVEYINNLLPGKGSIKISPSDNKYSGEIIKEFNILKRINEINISYLENSNEIRIDSLYGSPVLKYYSDKECKLEISKPSDYGSYYVRAEDMGDMYTEPSVSNTLNYIVGLDLSRVEIEYLDSNPIYYTGMAIEPEFKLIFNNEVVDITLYNIEYRNNTNPGSGEIIITPKNNIGFNSKSFSFNILKRINEINISYIPDSKEIKIDSLYGSPVLKYYSDKECTLEIPKPTSYGRYFVRAEDMGDEFTNPSVSNVLDYIVNLDLSATTIELVDNNPIYYKGSLIEPEIKVMYMSEVVDSSLYTIEYRNNKDPGSALIIITPRTNVSFNQKTFTFKILKRINTITISYVENTNEIKIDKLYGSPVLKYYEDIECTIPALDLSAPGSYYVRAEDTGDMYTEASVSNALEYIVPIDLAKASVNLLSEAPIYYTGSELRPEVKLSYNATIIDKAKYKLEYISNIDVGIAKIKITPADKSLSGEKIFEFRIQYAPPLIDEVKLVSGNDFIEFNYNLTELKTTYYLDILDGNTVVKTFNLKEGENKGYQVGLNLNKEYKVIIYSVTNEFKDIYSEKLIKTLDGKRVNAIFDLSPTLVDPNTTRMKYYVYISDPNKLYTTYELSIEDMVYGSIYYGEEPVNNVISGVMLDCWPSTYTITLDGALADSTIETIDTFEYIMESLVTPPKDFVKYTKPTLDSIKSRYTSTSIELDVQCAMPELLNGMPSLIFNIVDDLGNKYEQEIYGKDVIAITNQNASYLEISYTERLELDGIYHTYSTYNLGRLEIKEEITPKLIAANKNTNTLEMEFDINLKPGNRAVLKDETNSTEEDITGAKITKTLPQAITTYSYQIYDSSNSPVGEKVSLIVDPANYDVMAPTVFNPVNPRDVVKTFNQNNSENLYIYTGFEGDPSLSYVVRAKGMDPNYNQPEIIVKSKEKVCEITNLESWYGLEYMVGKEVGGVFYVGQANKFSESTKTTYTDYRGFATITSPEAGRTTVRLEMPINDRIYDFDNSSLYIGVGEPIILNNSDFTFDQGLNAYVYEITVDRAETQVDFRFKSNKNVKNLELIQSMITLKGSLYTDVSFM